jgi:hypothetical protein
MLTSVGLHCGAHARSAPLLRRQALELFEEREVEAVNVLGLREGGGQRARARVPLDRLPPRPDEAVERVSGRAARWLGASIAATGCAIDRHGGEQRLA